MASDHVEAAIGINLDDAGRGCAVAPVDACLIIYGRAIGIRVREGGDDAGEIVPFQGIDRGAAGG